MNAIDAIRTALEMNEKDLALIEDMRDAPLTQPTPRGGNHPLWVAGHLALTEGAFRYGMVGEPNPLDHWKEYFDAGTEPSADAGAYPPFDDLLKAYREQRARSMQLLEELGEEGVNQPLKLPPEELPSEFIDTFFRTNAHVFLTMAYHHSFHCGQVADARRAAGRKPLFV